LHLAHGCGDRLAHLAHDDRAELVLARAVQLGDAADEDGTVGGRGGRPGDGRGCRTCDGVVDLSVREGVVGGEGLAGGRVDDGVVGHVGPLVRWWALRQAQGPTTGQLLGIRVYLVDRYSWMPSAPPSRPMPDCLTPPNGAAALETTPTFRPI